MLSRLQENRNKEIDKYARAYTNPKYRMGEERKTNSTMVLTRYSTMGDSYLDIGAGRGEMLDHATQIGISRVKGTEVVPELLRDSRMERAEAHDLPYKTASWDIVSSFDVLEHLIPEDVPPAVSQLFRVAAKVVIISAASDSQMWEGIEQHPSRRPLADWEELLVKIGKWGKWRLIEYLPCRKNSGLWVFMH